MLRWKKMMRSGELSPRSVAENKWRNETDSSVSSQGRNIVRRVSEDSTSPPSKRIKVAAPLPLLLLSMDSDPAHLNGLHCFIRQNVEVFSATERDVNAPAPGRKNRVLIGQVGIRCVHCRHLPFKRRIKRASCYPSSVSRVYHSVSDMKFDHFGACHGMPIGLKNQFEELRRTCKRRGNSTVPSSSTAQYYSDSAKRLGMVNGVGGIFSKHAIEAAVGANVSLDDVPSFVNPGMDPAVHDLRGRPDLPFHDPRPSQKPAPFHPNAARLPWSIPNRDDPPVVLALPQDAANVNVLHCFVRKNVEVFQATERDVNAPAPGRRIRVEIGQVGIRCVHCRHLAPKDRVKRAICYPPSIGGIYHGVSNMKFDHFGACRGLDQTTRAEFRELRSSCTSRKGNAANSFNSTAQYYEDSANKMGLVDTPQGIRFGDNEHTGKLKARISFQGIRTLMQAATDPRVRAHFVKADDNVIPHSKLMCISSKNGGSFHEHVRSVYGQVGTRL